eukprot:43907-Prymnesium_polylepis.1
MGDRYTSDSLVCRTQVAIGASGRPARRRRIRPPPLKCPRWGRRTETARVARAVVKYIIKQTHRHGSQVFPVQSFLSENDLASAAVPQTQSGGA